MKLSLDRLAAALILGVLLLEPWSTLPVRAIDINVDVDVGNPLSILTKPKPKPKPKPAPVKPKAVTPAVAMLPAKGEKRLLSNEVLIETKPDITDAALTGIATRNRLRLVETADIALLTAKVHRFEITDGRSVRAVLGALNAERDILLAQPNYSYVADGLSATASSSEPPPSSSEAATDTPPPPAPPPQYAADLMHLNDVHALATGRAIKIGILDTAVTDNPAELTDSVALRFDGIGETANDDPSHGTSLAGIIAAHGQLNGVAPAAVLLSARAFVAADGKSPSSNSFVLLKGLDWLAANGAQIVNMSFAGPSDPLFLAEIKAARAKNILSIAAAGNDGPKAAPDFPAADPDTLGVTAIDDLEAILPEANRGDYVAIAAPGVDVIVLTPDGSYGTSSGTSMAAAHVSGAAALLLERDPTLTPDALSKLIVDTAQDLGPKGRDKTFGAGLIDPQHALGMLPEPTTDAAAAPSQ